MKIRVFISTFLVLLSLASTAQSTKGKDFWLGFMTNFSYTNDSLSVFISSETNTSGTISMPKAGWNQSFTVTANSTTQIVIPPSTAQAMGGIEDKGIHILSANDVSVFALNYSSRTSDATIIFPTNALGDDYFITTPETNKYSSELLIVATSDSTSINIEPTANILGGVSAGNTYNVILNAGEVFFCMSQDDLTGTRIYASSNNGQCGNFAVFSGNKCEFVGGCGWCDHLYEQMMPLKTWGKNYITIPLKTRSGDFIKILASQDATHVYENPGTFSVSLTALSSRGCSNDMLIEEMIEVYPLSVALYDKHPDNVSIFEPLYYFQNLSQNAVSWKWDFGDGNISVMEHPEHMYSDTGWHDIQLISISQNGCMDTTEGRVYVSPDFTLYVPNAFTPNGDMLNDGFAPVGKFDGIKEYALFIYDRWGELIFKTDDVNEQWNGRKYNQSHYDLCQDGSYVYYIQLIDFMQRLYEYKGTVVLLK